MSGVSPFKCLEASVNGADIRQMCSTVREKVKDSLSPALLSEIRRCQFQKRMRLADLSPARARLFHPTPVTFLVPGDGGANAADLPVEDAVLLKIFKHRQLLPDLPGQKPDEQTVPNNIIQQILAAVSLPTKGFGPHRNPIEYYNDVELRLLFDAPSHLCVEGFKNLQVQAVDIMCREVARPVPIGTILPFLDEEPAARELLRMLLVTRLFTCADGVRGAADVASLTTKDYIHISNLIKFYSGSMALVQVFAPHTPLLYHPLLPQTASIGDFYRLKWLSLREGDQLVQLLVFAAFTAGVVKDTLNELVKSFIVVLGDGMKNYTKSGPISKQFDRYDSTNNIGPLCEIIAKAFQVALMYYPTRETKKLIKESIMTIYEGLQDIAFPSTLDNWVPINGGLTFFRLFTEACARTAITGDMFTLALDTTARVFVSMNVNAFGRGARGTTYSPLWSFLCFRCMEAMLENPVKKVQYELRRSLQRYFRTELRDAHEESQLTSPVNPTDSFTDETLPLREFFSKDVSDIYEAHRIVLPNLIDRLVYLTLDDKSGFMMVVEADLFLYTLSREILYRNKVKAIESYFVHGCRTVAFLRFTIKVCVENEFYLPFLAPAFYKIKIPSYTVNPQRCEEALRHGMECDRLLEMVIEPTAASTNRRAPLPSAENGISPGSKAGGRPHSPRRKAALDGRQIDEDDRDNFSRGYLHYRVPHKPTRHPGLNHHGTLEETQDEEAIICVGGEEYMPPHLASLYFELRERTERNINEIQSRQSPMVDWKLQQVVNTIDTHYKFLD
ncbi:hypothetical protein ADEAN_000666100 [Angomonas deanei]|uniref:Uncharacterized protein n=1 Tax=Angomonas deanei TaxID=59799 RepID=A0A7G2CH16_9TRYP|nr:hypothetical protein ADEAN_000666100 [Angomonas deanei]